MAKIDLLNAFFVLVGVVTILGFVFYLVDRRPKPSDPAPPPSPAELVRRFSVLVVDDEVFPYIAQLEQDGFKVTRVPDIARYSDIDSFQYEVLLLDIFGIGAAVGAKHGGLDIIEYIKTRNPSQRVISYSSAKWGVADYKKMDLADARLDKADGYPAFRSTIEERFAELLQPITYLRSLGLSSEEVGRLSEAFRAVIGGIANPDDCEGVVASLAEDKQRAVRNALMHAGIVSDRIHMKGVR